MTRLELITHLAAAMPKLEMDAIHIYCLVAPGTEGFVTAPMVQAQTRLHIRNCQRALIRLTSENYLSRSASPEQAPRTRPAQGHPPDCYRLTPKGAALVKQLLSL